jgi:hypothetical protein
LVSNSFKDFLQFSIIIQTALLYFCEVNMPKKEHLQEPHKEIRVKDKKIQFGETENLCFACGEKIDPDAEVCPFCNTKQDKKN